MDPQNIPNSLMVPTQLPVDGKSWVASVHQISNLGLGFYKAFMYYKGLMIYCADNKTTYVWDEANENSGSTGLLTEDFVYPADAPEVNGISYASKAYNFFKVEETQKDRIIELSEITVSESILKIHNTEESPSKWIINGNLYQDTEERSIIIPPVTPSFFRVDYVIFYKADLMSNPVGYILGEEDEFNFIEPTVFPLNTLKVIPVYVSNVIEIGNPEPQEGDFVRKINYSNVNVNIGNATTIILDGTGKSFYRLKTVLGSGPLQINGFQDPIFIPSNYDNPYPGKIFGFINETGRGVIFKKAAAVNYPFHLENDIIVPNGKTLFLRWLGGATLTTKGFEFYYKNWTENKSVFINTSVIGSSMTDEDAVNTINSLPAFSKPDDTDLYFKILLNNGMPIEHSNIYVYKLKIGTGDYGTGGTLIADNQIELISIIRPNIGDVESLPTTQFINLGDIGSNTIEDGFNGHTFTGDEDPVQEQSEGYVVVNAIISGDPVKYLFVGEGGNYGVGGDKVATADDFLLSNNTDPAPISNFIGLSDTFNDYIGKKGHYLVVNDDEDGVTSQPLTEIIKIALSSPYEDLEDETRMFGLVATYNFKVIKFQIVAGEAPTGSGIILKMMKNNNDITSTHPTIPSGGNVSTNIAAFTDDEFDIGDIMEFEIPVGGVGSSNPGQNLQAEIIIEKI